MPYKDPIKNKEKARERGMRWEKNNPDKSKEKQKRYRIKNHDKIIKRHRKWYAEHTEKALAATEKWRKENPEKIRVQRRIWKNKKYHSNIQYKLIEILRSRLRLALRNNQKKGSTIDLLGCTIEEFKIYIENKFKEGMTWNNWSIKGWHIDHIIPLYHFDLSHEDQLRKACHYTNLQPMWAVENLRKNNKII